MQVPIKGFDDIFRDPTGTTVNATARYYGRLTKLPGSFAPRIAQERPPGICQPRRSTRIYQRATQLPLSFVYGQLPSETARKNDLNTQARILCGRHRGNAFDCQNTAGARTDPTLNERLEAAIASVRTTKPPMARFNAAEQLARLTRKVSPASVSDSTVRDLGFLFWTIRMM